MQSSFRTALLIATLCCAFTATAEEWLAGWQQTEAMNTARAGAAVVRAGDYLYVIGGVDGRRFLRSVEYTRIKPDGSLAPWRYTRALNEERGFVDAVAYGGYLYVVGGGNGPNGKTLLRSMERARILENGSLGAWQTLGSQLNIPRRCIKLAISGNRIFALGGFGGTLLDSVESVLIPDDGLPGRWRIGKDRLTLPRYVNAVKKVDGHLFVLGGHREREGGGIAAVESAQLRANHTLRPGWNEKTAMNRGRYGLSAAAHDGYLYALGGLDGAIYQDVVEQAGINDDGSLSAWRETTPLSSPRANFSSLAYQGHIYVIGGTNRAGYYKTVEYARFNAQGDIGFYANAAQKQRYERQQRQQASAYKTALPNRGTVSEIIQTRTYSYLKVLHEGGASWLAAPRDGYTQGEVIRYSRGLTMHDFFSRTLNRRFDEILFVERVQRQGAGD